MEHIPEKPSQFGTWRGTLAGMSTSAGQVDAGRIRSGTATTHYQPLVVVLLAYCAGLVLDRWFPQPLWLWGAGSGVALGVWTIRFRRKNTFSSALCVVLAVLLLAAAWHHARYRLFDTDDLGRFARLDAAPAYLRVRAPRAQERVTATESKPLRSLPSFDRTRLAVEIESIRDRDQWQAASGQATLLVEGHPLGIQPGDRLQVFARLSRPTPAANPDEFDYADYLRRQRQTSRLFTSFPDCVTQIETDSSWRVADTIAKWREQGRRMLFNNLRSDQAGLASAVLLGLRSDVSRETSEAFVETGTIHLLAISGLHIGILAGTLLLILRTGWIPQRPLLVLVIGFTIFYALLADTRPSVVRAAILVVVFCLSMYLGRPALRFNTLAAAGLIVLIWQPLELFNVGTQLSFLAVGTLICAAPVFERWQQQDALTRLIEATRPWPVRAVRWCGRWYFRMALAGLAIWLVALPLIMHHLHLVSPAGVVATPLLYLPLATALISGLAVLVFSSWAAPLAAVCGQVCDKSIALLNWGASAIRELPGSFFWVAGPEAWWVAGFYAGVVAWALLPAWRPARRWSCALMALWIVIGFAWPLVHKPHDQLRCTFLAVGHGCSVALELPDDRVMLYDAGRLASPHAAARSISSYLWSRGRTHIDAVVISHADVDHYNGLPELLEKFTVGVVYVSPVMLEAASQPDAGAAVSELFSALRAAKVPVQTIHGGQRLAGGDVQIDVLHPQERGVLAPDMNRVDNANSVVLAIEYAGRRVLLPGDLESPGAEDLMAEQPWDCDVLLAPHHGSPRSNPPGFAAWSTPEWTVVSGRRGSDLTAIHAAFGPPGRPQGQVLHTANTGAISITLRKLPKDSASSGARGGLAVERFIESTAAGRP